MAIVFTPCVLCIVSSITALALSCCFTSGTLRNSGESRSVPLGSLGCTENAQPVFGFGGAVVDLCLVMLELQGSESPPKKGEYDSSKNVYE